MSNIKGIRVILLPRLAHYYIQSIPPMKRPVLNSPFIIMVLSCLLWSCALTSNVNSYQLQGERVSIQPIEAEAQGIVPVAVLAALAPKVISFTTAKLKAYYSKESEKYVASYGTTYVGEDFYKDNGNHEFSYGGYEITRHIRSGNQEVPASSITLALMTNNEKTLMQFLPQKIQLQKAKAKLRTGDDTVDLSINVILNAWWQIKNGEIKSRELGDVTMVLTNIRLGDSYTLKGEPNNYYLQNQHREKSNYNVQSSWLAPVPISVSEQGNPLEHARGNYSLQITVTEIDDYGERVAQFGKDLHDSRGIITELLEQLLD